jgi:hypothetical protein
MVSASPTIADEIELLERKEKRSWRGSILADLLWAVLCVTAYNTTDWFSLSPLTSDFNFIITGVAIVVGWFAAHSFVRWCIPSIYWSWADRKRLEFLRRQVFRRVGVKA